MRKGVCLLVLLLFATTPGPAGADGTATTADASTTTDASPTAGTQTTAATATATTPATTGSGTTTASTTTTATTTTTDAPAFTPVGAAPLSTDCTTAGVGAIVLPGRAPLAVGAAPASFGPSVYSVDGNPIVSFESAEAAGTSCQPGAVSVRELSLFDGAVTAAAVSASSGRGSVDDLRVADQPVSLAPGGSISIDGWGLLVAGDEVDTTLTAPLSVHLLTAHGQLPAGTVVLVGFGARPAAPAPTAAATTASPTASPTASTPPPGARATPATASAARATATRSAGKRRHAKRHKVKHLPLKVTPPLGQPGYVFPVARGASYGDTYGGLRSDIADGWHHGDDLFAPLGTPVVAVADGTLSLVGWNRLGGWRLWLKDAAGNQFYYAHLAAYSRWILDHRTVKAGQVIGFLGRTGDAFTTQPHLHFEIHPKSLLRLKYDGAVDPTSYLQTWKVEWPLNRDLPKPALLRAPKGTPSEEAGVVWRQLLAKQPDVAPPRAKTTAPPRHRSPHDNGNLTLAAGATPAAATERTGAQLPASDGTIALLLLGGVAGAGALTALTLRSRGRRRDPGPALLAEPGRDPEPEREALPFEAPPSVPPAGPAQPPAAPHSTSPLGTLGGLVGMSTLTAQMLRRLGRRA
jgi:murein DD-endopeptidase MepM/ murein hydrolase activator NlpD